MKKPRVYATFPLPDAVKQRLLAQYEVRDWPHLSAPDRQTLLSECKQAAGILCTLSTRLDSDLFDQCQNLQVVSTCSVGADHIDVNWLSARKIPLGYTPNVLVATTAELTMAMMLATTRRIVEADAYVRQGLWQPSQAWHLDMLLGQDLDCSTLGIIGLGEIGQAVATRAQAFGMRIIGWTPSGRTVPGIEAVSLNELYARADIVSVHLAYSESSHHLIDSNAFKQMKSNAILINTARGGIVDQQALYQALINQQIAGAGLDVFAQEPIDQDDPLLKLDNVVVAPHIGSATVRTRKKMLNQAVENLLAGLEQRPLPDCFNANGLTT